MEGQMSIYYDEEGDYLEVFVERQSPTYGEEIEDDLTLSKREDNDEVAGIGIMNFRKRSKSLSDIKLSLPFKINFSSLSY